jgi:hypothetical protein
MDLNVSLELDADDPNRFYLSRGLKLHFERLLSAFLYIIVVLILFLIWVGVMFWEHIIRNIVDVLISKPKSDL